MLRLALAILLLPALLPACSCIGSGPPCEAAWRVSAVFLGTLTKLTHDHRDPDAHGLIQVNGFLGTHAVFDVEEAFIGMEKTLKQLEIRTGMGGGDCGYAFQSGKSYVVYAYRGADGTFSTGICSRTQLAEKASDDLVYLRSLQNSTPPAFVAGYVTDGEVRTSYYPDLNSPPPNGLSGATVRLSKDGNTVSTITKDDGSFRFDVLAPGKYKLSVSKENYSVTPWMERDLEVHAAGCAFAWKDMVVDRRLSGNVLLADGTPASHVDIQLVSTALESGTTDTVRTNGQGRYSFTNIRPGNYYLGVNVGRLPSKELPFAPTYFPGVGAAAAATIIGIGNGAGEQHYDFFLPAAQSERKIEGVVLWPDGRPASSVPLFLDDPNSTRSGYTVSATTDAAGRFTLSVFDKTNYRLQAVHYGADSRTPTSIEPLVLTPQTEITQPLRLVLTRPGDSNRTP